jgi:3-hydroxyacyl-[acyl-carrier-protein] dehydratase
MVLVDRVVAVEPGKRIETLKAISATDPCFEGVPANAPRDWYGYPVSLLIESFGQSAALLWILSGTGSLEELDLLPVFAAASNCEIEGRAIPGDVLRHVVRIDRSYDDFAFVSGETFVDERRLMTVGSMAAASVPAESLEIPTGHQAGRL